MKIRIVSIILGWAVFLSATIWLILSDLKVLPRISLIDRYYWLLLVLFILIAGTNLINRLKR
ncbi:hypothetical protein FEI14_11340 [Lacticaseibacillus zeae]|uniref:Uncharacterized protein n=1 Tax=Lacticaseibacillus zeae TaxID=57037 RepID=A0A5R8LRS6_LACZE|nr:hypothetical protein FEI14_11340 [Lacticaseibacillus zeae]